MDENESQTTRAVLPEVISIADQDNKPALEPWSEHNPPASTSTVHTVGQANN